MRYATVCSGIEAPSVAWSGMGWAPAFFAETAAFPKAVLNRRFPNVPDLGDMARIDGKAWQGETDVLIGGTPCQSFSPVGLRRSLEDPRGNLTVAFAWLANDLRPDFLVRENVPGVLSSRDNAFGCLLGALAGDGSPLEPGPRPDEGKSGVFWNWSGKLRRHVPTWSKSGHVLGPERAVA